MYIVFLSIWISCAALAWHNIPIDRPDMVFVDVIPPNPMTENRINTDQREIGLFVRKFHRLPKSLSELLPLDARDDGDNFIKDGWGQPLIYRPQTDGSVVLGSLGESGKNDARLIRFSIIDPEDRKNSMDEILTFSDMKDLENEIRGYAKMEHRLPARLSDLDGNPFNNTIDEWGRPIQYIPQPDGSVILKSQGKIGSNQIFSRQFTVPGIQTKGPTDATKENTN